MNDLQRINKIVSKDKFSNGDLKWLVDNNYDFFWDSKKISLKSLDIKYE
jgi:hypothetical protein